MQNLSIGRHIFGDPYVTTDDSVVTNSNAAEDGAVAVYDNIVFEDGMAIDALNGASLLVEGEALGTEGDALIELHMATQDTGGANDDTGAVVDGEVAADGGCRVYVDTRFTMSHLGDDAGNEGYAQEMELMCYAETCDGAYGGIAADDLAVAGGCRVALVGGRHIGGEEAA